MQNATDGTTVLPIVADVSRLLAIEQKIDDHATPVPRIRVQTRTGDG